MSADAVAWLRRQIEDDKKTAELISAGGFAPERWDADPQGQVNPGEMPEAQAITLLLDPDAADPAFPRREYWTALYIWERENHEPESARVRESDLPVVIVNNGRREADHIQRHDPLGAVADCEAKLAILDLHRPVLEEYADADGQSRSSYECDECDPAGSPGNWPCRTVRLIASAYRHRPGYSDHWPEQAGVAG